MHADKLAIYLNDHLAGATFGVGLARRIARRQRDAAPGADLERLAAQVTEDRRALLAIMDELGVPARRYKIYGGWAAERLGRLKPNGALYRRSGLSTLIELEAMRVGVEGKALGWRTLLMVAQREGGLDEERVRALLDRALGQIETLETLRLAAAAANFSADPAGSANSADSPDPADGHSLTPGAR
ncbi:hypothetical protein OHB04_19395 [Streptomyces sp. NBC_01775]|uniref:hypothetical protein n=1 Tax=Streptomyces sp. NBC_01775 TaxID=2975939 RepID=UPI002DDC57F9|nr:hypothetical protein [Streptomyces sp. NBC_01775]WSB77729.1 hypothetical protein OHB04_19395 [Streptomyces sp. NBC_01775]